MAIVVGDCGSCCNPIEVTDGDTITLSSAGCCYHYEISLSSCQISDGITFTNSSGSALHINVKGVVDDDVMFNGSVYEDGEYCYYRSDCPGGYTPCTYVNGAHSFEYNSTIANSSSILIQGVDNGIGGGIDCTIKFS